MPSLFSMYTSSMPFVDACALLNLASRPYLIDKVMLQAIIALHGKGFSTAVLMAYVDLMMGG